MEAPETAGTALKTVLARFSEVKELYSQGQLLGTDEEGQEIDVNNISKALRTAGINLNEYLAGAKGLDDILLELSSKWDSLDTVQQRYIATMAAGSRQQSRFIAMMSDYGRTMELVNAANNSAGASQRQYEKTLDSMKTSLARLENAWNEFTQGLANNEILKAGIDTITLLLQTVNKLTDALSGGNGLVKSFLNLSTAAIGLKMVGAIFNAGFETFSKAGREAGTTFGVAFKTEFQNSFKKVFDLISNIKTKSSIKSSLQKPMAEYAASSKAAEVATNNLAKARSAFYKKQAEYIAIDSAINEGKATHIELQKKDEEVTAAEISIKEIENKIDATGVQLQNAKTMALTSLSQAYNLNNAQAETALALTSRGVSVDLAAAAVKAGLTQEEINIAIARAGGVNATDLQIRAELEKMAVEKSSQGISLKYIATLIGKTVGDKAAAVAAKGHTGALIAEKAAQVALNHSMLVGIGIMGLAAGAVGLLIAGIVSIVKSIKENSPEEQIKRLDESIEKVGAEADEAAEKFDNLNTSLEELEEKYKTFNELTKGTQEWKRALIDTNNYVLDLIEKYPELSKFVSSEGGILRIDVNDKEVQQVLDSYNQREVVLRNTEAGLKIKQTNLTDRMNGTAWDNFISETADRRNVLSTLYGNLQKDDAKYQYKSQQEVMTMIANQLASGEITKDYLLENMGDMYEGGDFEEIFTALSNLAAGLFEADEALKPFYNSIEQNTLALIDYDKYSQKQIDQMSTFLDPDKIDKLTKRYDADYSSITLEEIRTELEQIYGTKVTRSGDKFTYFEGEEKKELTYDEAKDMYAYSKATKAATRIIQDFANSIKNTTPEIQRVFAKDEGGALTQDDIIRLSGADKIEDVLKEDFDQKELRKNATAVWENMSDEAKALYDGDPSKFFDEFISNIIIGAKRFVDIVGDTKFQFDTGKIGSDALAKYIEKRDTLRLAGVNVSVVETELASILTKIPEESRDAFLTAFNLINLEDIDEVRGFSDTISAAGITVDGGISALDDFENEIIKVTGATKKYSSELIKGYEDLKDDIAGREDTEREFTTEQRNSLVGLDPKFAELFVQTGEDEWTYVGDSMQTLVSALEDNTAAILGKNVEEISEKVKKGEQIEAFANRSGQKMRYSQEFDTYYLQNNQQIIKDILNNNLNKYSSNELNTIALQLGIENQSMSDLDSKEKLAEYLVQYVKDYYGANGVTLAENQILEQNAKTHQLSQFDSAREMLVSGNGVDSSIINAALDAQITKTEGASIALAQLTKNGKEADAILKALAIDSTRMANKNSELTKKVLNYKDVLVSTNRESIEYTKALDDVINNLNAYAGIKIDDQFYIDHQELIEKMAAGEIEAWDELSKLLLEEFINTVDETGKITATGINDILNLVGDIDIGMTATFDSSAAMEVFPWLDAVESGVETTAEDINKLSSIFSLLGYTLEPIRETITVQGGPGSGDIRTTAQTDDGKKAMSFTTMEVTTGFKVTKNGDGLGDRPQIKNSGDNGSTSEIEEWENPYDWLYNKTEQINKKLREREKLERNYNKLVESRIATTSELEANSNAELDKLETRKKIMEETLGLREQEMHRVMDENQDMLKYGSYDFDTGLIDIDWDLINTVTDPEEGQRIEEYISNLEEVRDKMWDLEDGIEDIEDDIQEVNERGKDEYSNLEDRIKDAIINARQDEIDKLSAINDSINDTNSKILDSMQKAIDQQRQDRENQKTEEEISEKQRRLVYLQQDTSGANALEILQLQDEIAQAQESYTDQLIDQKITELQQQNDAAAEQRQKQIEIMQSQLEYDKNYGEIAKQTEEFIKQVVSEKGVIVNNSNLANLLMTADGFESLTGFQATEWFKVLQSQAALATLYYDQQLGRIKDRDFDSEIRDALSRGDLKKASELERLRNQQMIYLGREDEQTYSYVDNDWSRWGYKEPSTQPEPAPAPQPEPPKEKQISVGGKINAGNALIYNSEDDSVGQHQYFANDPIYTVLKEVDNYLMVRWHKLSSGVTGWFKKSDVKAYKTGGLANFTGPAWLDGTPSKPEIILNQKDSQNFIQLKDILSSLLNSKSGNKSESNGDNYYDIDINVEKIENDYTVDQIAAKLKDMIRNDAIYRNVNVINNMR